MRRLNQPGDKYNMLTLVALHRRARGGNIWLVRCECGNERTICVRDIVNGHTKSCGCKTAAMKAEKKRTHGMTYTREYRVWSHMIGRCHNPTDHKFPQYGAQGISVCPRWRDRFEAFFADMGHCPAGMSIDRVDNDRGYEPGNCRWATAKVQSQNRRYLKKVVLFGRETLVVEAERALGLGRWGIRQRAAKNGETIQQATNHFATKVAA